MKKLLLFAAAALLCSTSMFAEEKVLWQTGDPAMEETTGHVPGQYQTGLILAPSVFEGLKPGTQLNIDISSSAWVQVYIKNYDGTQIYPSIDLNAGENISVVLTKFQLDQIAASAFRIEASGVMDITKITAVTDAYTGDLDNALWIGRREFTADWGGTPIQICGLEAKMLEVNDKIKLVYTSTGSVQVMVNYNDASGANKDYYWSDAANGTEFTVNSDFVGFLNEYGKGFAVKGASIIVTQIDLIKAKETDICTTVSVDQPDFVDVYNAAGMPVYTKVKAADVINTLPAGLYIVGGKKIVIR